MSAFGAIERRHALEAGPMTVLSWARRERSDRVLDSAARVAVGAAPLDTTLLARRGL
jgi:hypothetical protein